MFGTGVQKAAISARSGQMYARVGLPEEAPLLRQEAAEG
jgi:hypothetical protein